jgi:hypothetical protein
MDMQVTTKNAASGAGNGFLTTVVVFIKLPYWIRPLDSSMALVRAMTQKCPRIELSSIRENP